MITLLRPSPSGSVVIVRASAQIADKSQLHEIMITMSGTKNWLWRAVDPGGFVLDVRLHSRRNTGAAGRLMRKLVKRQGSVPCVVIADKLRSYKGAKREVMPIVEPRTHKGRKSRSENSHQPTRRREREMKRFKSFCFLQLILGIHHPAINVLHLGRQRTKPNDFSAVKSLAMQTCREIAHFEVA